MQSAFHEYWKTLCVGETNPGKILITNLTGRNSVRKSGFSCSIWLATPHFLTLLVPPVLVFCNGLPQIVLEVGKIQSDGRLLWTAVVGRDNWSQSKIVLHFIDDRSYTLYYRQHVFPEVIDHAKHWQPGIHELENNLFNCLKRWRTLSDKRLWWQIEVHQHNFSWLLLFSFLSSFV